MWTRLSCRGSAGSIAIFGPILESGFSPRDGSFTSDNHPDKEQRHDGKRRDAERSVAGILADPGGAPMEEHERRPGPERTKAISSHKSLHVAKAV